ncbi:Rha family transcriptional regulator [Gluconobacter sphaericus]|uniref:Rha family transcriptional regulator n=1 Tax=Gluconobacter sphaericus TaxID=574987 RepID=UPI00312B4787
MTNNTQAITISSALSSGAPTMSSREVADICGARHNDVVATIERLFENGVLRESRKTTRTYRPEKGGRPTEVYDLTKRDTLVVVSGYNDEVRAKIIDRWIELEKGCADEIRTRKSRSRKPSVASIFKSRFAIGRLIGLDENQAAIAAGRACEKKCGENPLPDMGLTYLEAPTQQRTMTATQIAEALNLPGKQPGMAGNNLMAAAGLQTFHRDKRNKKVWTPTEAGMPFARLCDVGKGHSDGSVPTYQWLPSVLEPLRLHLATTVEAPPFTKNPEPVS